MNRFRIWLSLGLLVFMAGCTDSESVTQPATKSISSYRQNEQLLWPGGAPDAKDIPNNEIYKDGHISNVSIPTLTAFYPPAEIATDAAVIICPGGGYRILSIEKEGSDIAKWLNSFGVTAFVLKYRLTTPNGTGYHYPAQFNDLKRAIRTLRNSAKDFKIDPQKIGVIGFSAGGHLSSTVGTHFESGDKNASDVIERVSCRPDFMILIYPHISLTDAGTSQSYVTNLLGKEYKPELPDYLSNEKQVTKQTPPTFLVHASDDQIVPPEPTVDFYLAMRKAGVKGQLHIFEKAGHGFGLAKEKGPAENWPALCEQWIKGMDILKDP